MNRTRRLLAVTAIGAFLVVGVAACGSSGGSDTSSGADAADTEATTGGTDPGADSSSDAGTDQGAGEADCESTANSDNLSGDSVVLFSADQDELKDADLTDEDIATVAADSSSMDPGTIEIGAGELFGIQVESGGNIDGLIIGCAGGQTLTPNAVIGFVITEPGTYPVSLEIAGTELGSVVVS